MMASLMRLSFFFWGNPRFCIGDLRCYRFYSFCKCTFLSSSIILVKNILLFESIDTRIYKRKSLINLLYIFFLFRKKSREYFCTFFKKSEKMTITRSFFFTNLEGFFCWTSYWHKGKWQNKIILSGKVGALYKKWLSCQTKMIKCSVFASGRLRELLKQLQELLPYPVKSVHETLLNTHLIQLIDHKVPLLQSFHTSLLLWKEIMYT